MTICQLSPTFCTRCGTKNKVVPTGYYDCETGNAQLTGECPNPNCCGTKGHALPRFRLRDLLKTKYCTQCHEPIFTGGSWD